jgi:hypothetical protein
MPQVALPDSCSYAGYLGVSTLYTFKIDIISQASSSTDPGHRNFSYDVIDDFFIDAPFKILLGILGYWPLMI